MAAVTGVVFWDDACDEEDVEDVEDSEDAEETDDEVDDTEEVDEEMGGATTTISVAGL